MIALREDVYKMLDSIAQIQHEEWNTPSKNLTYSLEIMIKTSFKNYSKKTETVEQTRLNMTFDKKDENKAKNNDFLNDNEVKDITMQSLNESNKGKEDIEEQIRAWKEARKNR